MILSPRRRIRSLILLLASLFFAIWCLHIYINTPPQAQYIGDNLHTIESERSRAARNGIGQDGLTDQKAEELCQLYGWKPYRRLGRGQDPPPRRKVYDLFLLNTELDWLEVRLNELHEHVDYFIIVEANTTFSNRPKPILLNQPEIWQKFAPFHDKIIHHIVVGRGEHEPGPMDHEQFQRDSALTQVFPTLGQPRANPPEPPQPYQQYPLSTAAASSPASTPHLGDVILVSDLDEIPRPATLTLLRTCAFPRRVNLRSRFYYYSFQWLHRGPDWSHPQATYYEGAQNTIPPTDLRMGVGGGSILRNWFGPRADLFNASWHCSSCFATVAEMQNKIRSFSHIKYNRPEFVDKGMLVHRVRNGLDLFDRKEQVYERVVGNGDLPGFLRGERERERFRYMVDRDGEDGGFRDFYQV
ncbi:hypothetical protein FQN55_000154 [Onygenales sp. PD_40]|nr:hypothetical protein FQN55_000154 [Onygenales sp. PD_40]